MKTLFSALLKRKKGNVNLVGALLVGIAMVVIFIVVHISVRSIKSIPEHYYNLLPVAERSDLDGDGIADRSDDSDGDGIPDRVDMTPYGNEVDILELRTRSPLRTGLTNR